MNKNLKKFKSFYFEKYEFDKNNLKAKFYYSFDREEKFVETIDFLCEGFEVRDDLDEEIVNSLLFHLHIALGISYYKAYPTNELIVESGFLDEKQKKFWKKFYKNGLGEFIYKNEIDYKNLFNFVNLSPLPTREGIKGWATKDKSLIPLGGGKDSIVTIEEYKEKNNKSRDTLQCVSTKKTNKYNFDTVVFGKVDRIKQGCIDVGGFKNLLIKRKLSDNIFKLNEKGYYNGHVPITGIIAFSLIVTAYIYGYKEIVLSNEKSANSGNTNLGDFEINHQYSKSLEFEDDFSNYVSNYMTDDIKYFSYLRNLYEIEIAETFSKIGKKYFKVFSSCNNNFKILNNPPLTPPSKGGEKEKNSPPWHGGAGGGNWCCKCEKCCFVFCILRAYINEEEIISIFGENLYDNKELEETFSQLLGFSEIKPFECVGEEHEVRFAMKKTIDELENRKLPYILEKYENKL